jgi:hypothetical protein
MLQTMVQTYPLCFAAIEGEKIRLLSTNERRLSISSQPNSPLRISPFCVSPTSQSPETQGFRAASVRGVLFDSVPSSKFAKQTTVILSERSESKDPRRY